MVQKSPASTGRVLAAVVAFLIVLPASAPAADPTWLGEQRVESGQTTIYGLSCASVSLCVAAAGAGPVVQDGDLPWQPVVDPDPGHSPSAVSCAPATTFCMFVDDAGGAFTLSGGAFGARTSMDGTAELTGVSCPTSTFCMAIDRDHRVIKYAGGSWDGGTTLPVPGIASTFTAVSCTSPSFCAAVAGQSTGGTYGTVAFTFNGSTWSGASTPFDTTTQTQAYPTSISCTSSSHCLVTHEEGRLSRFNGATWSTAANRIDTYNDHPRPLVSCVGSTCMAVDFYDNFTRSTDGGVNWTPLVNFKSTGLAGGIGGIHSLACVSATLCIAGDGLGQVTTFAVPPQPAPPSISGSAFVGQTLSLTRGTVQTPGAWYRDAWWRCSDPGSGCGSSPISTSSTGYTLAAEDTGSYVEAREIFGFGFYSSTAVTTNVIGPVCNGTCPSPAPGGGTTGGGTTGSPTGGTPTPTLSGLSVPTASVRAGLRISFTLAASARAVKVTFARRTLGRRSGGRCVAKTRRNRRKRSCVRYVRIGTRSVADVPAGSTTLKVTKVGGRAFKPGTYRVTVQVFDADGHGLTPAVRTVRIRS